MTKTKINYRIKKIKNIKREYDNTFWKKVVALAMKILLPHYPMKALREAIANAIIHRDYSTNTDGAYIYLRIFDDRIEILNPGGLYGNNRLENLGSDNMLEVRNNTIIRLLEDTTDIVENRHTGIATMREEMKKMNLPEPEFENLRGTFKVTFRKEKEETDVQNKTEQIQSVQKWTEVKL